MLKRSKINIFAYNFKLIFTFHKKAILYYNNQTLTYFIKKKLLSKMILQMS